MTETIVETFRSNGFTIPKGTSETIVNHLYMVARHGVVIYRPTKNEDVSEEFKKVAQFIGLTIFSNEAGLCFVNEHGSGSNRHWMS